MYIIKFLNHNSPYYLANWSGGDPARTLVPESARRFSFKHAAKAFRTKTINRNQHRYRGLSADSISEIIEIT